MTEVRSWLASPVRVTALIAGVALVLRFVIIALGTSNAEYFLFNVEFLLFGYLFAAWNSVVFGGVAGLLWTPALAYTGWGVAPPVATPAIEPTSRSRAITAHLTCSVLYFYAVTTAERTIPYVTQIPGAQLNWVLGSALVTAAVLTAYWKLELGGFSLAKQKQLAATYGLVLGAHFAAYLIVLYYIF